MPQNKPTRMPWVVCTFVNDETFGRCLDIETAHVDTPVPILNQDSIIETSASTRLFVYTHTRCKCGENMSLQERMTATMVSGWVRSRAKGVDVVEGGLTRTREAVWIESCIVNRHRKLLSVRAIGLRPVRDAYFSASEMWSKKSAARLSDCAQQRHWCRRTVLLCGRLVMLLRRRHGDHRFTAFVLIVSIRSRLAYRACRKGNRYRVTLGGAVNETILASSKRAAYPS